ncbi:MAG: septum formation initiator family protein [Bacillota bacterium]|nr:septum formation initiator family protein [Bacillota bacterium]
MSRERRFPRDQGRRTDGRYRQSTAAATAPSYDYGYPFGERAKPAPRRTRPRVRSRRRSAADRRFAAFLVALLVWAGIGYATGLVRIIALRREIARVERELAATRRHNQELEKAVAEMQTPEYIERAARDLLGLMRPDEVRVVVGRPADTTNPDRRDVARRPGTGDIYD